jgi:hypothetical protein
MPCDAFGEKRFKWRDDWTRLKWRAQGDDFKTFLCDFVAAVTQLEFPAAMSF